MNSYKNTLSLRKHSKSLNIALTYAVWACAIASSPLTAQNPCAGTTTDCSGTHITDQRIEQNKANKFIEYDKNGQFAGLTDHAKELITRSRDMLRARNQNFNQKFKQFGSIYHAAHVNRLTQGNMFLYGPPGAAKSQFITWLFDHEKEKAFQLQMNQMMTEQAFVGGQNFNAAQEGRFEIDTKGSLADFSLALIDEIDKGNPAALASLLSLLNERKILAGNKIIQSKLETIFTTSNANKYEIMQQFAANGMGSTAEALFNRFTTTGFVPNWLSTQDQTTLDQKWIDTCFGDAFTDADNKKNPQAQESNALMLDWQELRELAYMIFKPTEEFLSNFRELANMLRAKTIQALQASKESAAIASDPDEALPYYPTAIYTERLRQKMLGIVLMSVLLDTLNSKIVDDVACFENTLKNLESHRLPVGPLSLWRAYLATTTVSFGDAKLIFPTNDNQLKNIRLDFGDFFKSSENSDAKSKYMPHDKREELTVKYMIEEQKRFADIYSKLVDKYKDGLQQNAALTESLGCGAGADNSATFDVEKMLFAART